MRYFLEFSYDGTNYHGWQIQPNALSVQERIQMALSTILRNETEVMGAGRTDAGVHAIQMFCHFDTVDAIKDESKFVYQINSMLPKDIAVKEVRSVSDEAHARFDALSRTYMYRISLKKDPFEVNRSWMFPFELDLDAMNRACEILKTFVDFSCFSKSNTQTKTNNCRIDFAHWNQDGSQILFEIKADRFLRNMVRAIVGTMIEVGKKEMNLDEFRSVVESGDRSQAGFSVPAQGLYLKTIEYPDQFFNF